MPRPRAVPGNLKLDGPKVRACATELTLMNHAACVLSTMPAYFIRDAIKEKIARLASEHPELMRKVLLRTAQELRKNGEPINELSIRDVIADLDDEQLSPMLDALERIGLALASK